MSIYSNYVRGSEAQMLVQEANDCIQTTEDSLGDVEGFIENLIEQYDEVLNEKCEFEDQANNAEEERDEWKAKYEALHATSSELISLVSSLHLASDELLKYTTKKLKDLGALNASENSDSGSGDSSTDSSEGDNH